MSTPPPGFSLLPNKYGNGGAEGGRALSGGLPSPQMASPGQQRRVTALLPIEQGAQIQILIETCKSNWN